MSIREDSLLFLLGAGASVDSGIKHAKQMTDDIEEKIKNDCEFIKLDELYNYLKSSIIYQRGLEGNFRGQSPTIEDLLNVLSEIKQKHKNKLYPFIGSWNIHLLQVAGEDFVKITDFDKKIRGQLFKWINIPHYDKSDYFKKVGTLATEIGSPIRIFTLNYDLCVEKSLSNYFTIESGFNENREWEASRFDKNENANIDIYLYKLHGSIDWRRDDKRGHILMKCDTPQDNPELIFGATAKLSSIDPYLFYVHEFRKYSLQEPLRFIVTIGYSFSDEYINRLIAQSIMRNEFARILIVSPSASNQEEINRIAKLLNIETKKIISESLTAKEFFDTKVNLEYFEKQISTLKDDVPF